MMALGREGFHSYTTQIMDVTQIIAKGICTIPHLKLLGNTVYYVYVIMYYMIIMVNSTTRFIVCKYNICYTQLHDHH